MPGKPPHCLPRPTAWLPPANESVTTNAAASETKRRVFILAPHEAFLVRAGNLRLRCSPSVRNDCDRNTYAQESAESGALCRVLWHIHLMTKLLEQAL